MYRSSSAWLSSAFSRLNLVIPPFVGRGWGEGARVKNYFFCHHPQVASWETSGMRPMIVLTSYPPTFSVFMI